LILLLLLVTSTKLSLLSMTSIRRVVADKNNYSFYINDRLDEDCL
jgi:hypothetical protein